MIPKEEGLYGQGVVLEPLTNDSVARFQNRIGTRMSVEDHQFDGVNSTLTRPIRIHAGIP